MIELKELVERDEDFVRSAVQTLVQGALEAEMTEAIGAAKGERTEGRVSYRSGYYSRSLITRVGTLELHVPQDRAGRFSTELFARYQRIPFRRSFPWDIDPASRVVPQRWRSLHICNNGG